MPSIEAENAANSELLASFSTKSEGITDILIRSSSYAEVSNNHINNTSEDTGSPALFIISDDIRDGKRSQLDSLGVILGR